MRAVKIKRKNIAILFFSLFLALAVFSQIKVANSKPTYDVGLNKADWLYYKTNNDITAYLGKKSSNLPTVRYQKNKDYLEFSMTGVSSTTSVSLETDVKTPNTPTLFYRNIFDGVDANYQITNMPFRVKEEIILHNPPAAPERNYGGRSSENLTFVFDAKTTATPRKQKDGSIAFFDDKGDYLFQLDKPFMIDANFNRSEAVSIEIVPTNKKSIVSNGFFDALVGASAGIVNRADSLANRNVLSSSLANIKKLFYHKENFNQNRHPMSVLGQQQYTLILSADSAWLSTATYPIIIDPTIAHNADANFTGQMNRIADNDSTSSAQLESSYGENANDPYAVLNLHFNEANGTTVGIRDYASTTRVITANGNASTTNYVTQLGMGNSAAFDGTSDYFEIADSDDWDFTASSTDVTISMWVYANDILNTRLIGQSNAGADGNWSLGISQSDNNGDIYLGTAGGPVLSSGNSAIVAGRWYHIAIAKRNGFTEMYKDGLLVASGSASYFNAATTFLRIGARAAADGDFNGYMDEIRILKGRALTSEEIKAAAARRPCAVYTSSVLDASASVAWNTLNWTEGGVNTGDGEQPYNTGSLVAQWDFNDTSGTTLTASSSGSCTTSCNGTLTNFAYTASQDQATTTTGWTANNKKWGAGALMFDGTNDYVSVADNDGWNFGSGDFTIESWVNFSVLSGNHQIVIQDPGGGQSAFQFYYRNASTQLRLLLSSDGTTNWNIYNSATTTFPLGVWQHIVLVRNSGNLKFFINGIQSGSTQSSNETIFNSNGNLLIGGTGSEGLGGVLDSTRIYKGKALSQAEILSNYNAGNIEIQTRTGPPPTPTTALGKRGNRRRAKRNYCQWTATKETGTRPSR